MITYITRRCLQAIFIIFALSIFFFLLLKIAPTGPCDRYLDTVSNGVSAQARFNACYRARGLGNPWPAQYLDWLGQSVHGNFGLDIQDNPIGEDIGQRLPATLILVGASYILQELLALPLGLLGALKRYSFYDQIFTFLSYIGLSMPTFWLGLMLKIIFAVTLGILPFTGIINPNATIPDFGTNAYWSYFATNFWSALSDLLQHLILPAVTLAVVGVATDSRFMRASMLDVINQDYIRTARAKGLPRRIVVLKHALRNALLPIITNIGSVFIPTLVAGSIVTETIFKWPGMGALYAQSATQLDTPTLQTILLLAALFVIIGNLVADIGYAWADPRIRYS